MRADVPFEFVVQNTTAPSGEYVITVLSGSVVRLVGSSSRYLVSANSEGTNTYASPGAKLVFNRYGNQYFLSHILTPQTSRDFPMSRVERELKKSTVAGVRQSQTEILLAMR